MKKVKLSFAALVLVLAIAATSTVNATRANTDALPCSVIDPDGSLCNDETSIECCEDDAHNIKTQRARPQ